MKKLLIIDGNSILNRAYYGIRPLSTKEGFPTNAIFGMISILKRHMDALHPEYAVIAFDVKAKTFRHKACDFYKATRKPMPEDLALQLPVAKECARLLGFNVLELEGYEADDILGTVSRIAMKNQDVHSYILTGDKDSLQLLNDQCSVILVKTKEDTLYTPQSFISEYGVTPTQFIDMKAIMGDTSDNIPGISGIGEKGAQKLVSTFGSLDSIYENYQSSTDISDLVKHKIEVGKDMAYTSKFLATIVCDAPIEKTLNDFVFHKISASELGKFLSKYEFTSLFKKFGISADDIIDDEANEQASWELSPIPSPDMIDSMSNELIAIYPCDDIIYACTDKYYFTYYFNPMDDFLTRNKIICHDYKTLIKKYELNCVFDTMLAAYVTSPSDSSYEIDTLSSRYLKVIFKEEDAPKIIYSLYNILSQKLIETDTVKILTDIEIPLAEVLASMETEGFRIDTRGLDFYAKRIEELAEESKERIYSLAGEKFNINSPKQLGEILFGKMKLPHGKKTKNGYSTSAETLESLRSESPIINEILEYRQITKLHSTYCEGLLKVADENGRIHSTFNQTVTVTGRLSSTEPNLQNIPIKTSLGRELRKFFITKGLGYVLIDADYSQIELKVLAHLSRDANMIHAFNSGADIHAITASQVFKVPIEEVTPIMRKNAKAVNFGIVYGIGDFSLGKDIHVSTKEARSYINSYFDSYPDIHNYINSLVEQATEKGYAKTMFGRIRYIPELSAENHNLRAFGKRVAMNSPIQGSAADIIKIAMINVYKALKKADIDAKLILQVHDELIIESHVSCAEQAQKILKTEMENAVKLLVPLTADTGIGDNWLDAK
ncbi:MAG: DNA polymerase I [Clostridia bacterium]|nr:DNA polymerase I [Clostridia bacterium]